jgi:hypothetical protein
MTHVTLGIAPRWFGDRDLVELYFRGLLFRSTKRRDFALDFNQTNDYGAIGLINCDPKSDYGECEIAAKRLNDKTQFYDSNDVFAEARKLSKEDREEHARVEKLISDFLAEKRD